ncbi:MAG: UDP binding domain-containing protein, partial [Candidatus Omnitrophota bacterium]
KLIKQEMWILKDKTIGIWGLSFKPCTDDMRNAPSVGIIKALQQEGARIRVFDPQAMDKAKEYLSAVTFCNDAYTAVKGSDCLAVITEWNEFKEIDFKRVKKLLRQPLIFDGRNIYDPSVMARMGFRYYCIGRKLV